MRVSIIMLHMDLAPHKVEQDAIQFYLNEERSLILSLQVVLLRGPAHEPPLSLSLSLSLSLLSISSSFPIVSLAKIVSLTFQHNQSVVILLTLENIWRLKLACEL